MFQNSSISAKFCSPCFLCDLCVSVVKILFPFPRALSFFFSVRSVSCENFCVNSLPLVAALPRCASVVYKLQREIGDTWMQVSEKQELKNPARNGDLASK